MGLLQSELKQLADSGFDVDLTGFDIDLTGFDDSMLSNFQPSNMPSMTNFEV